MFRPEIIPMTACGPATSSRWGPAPCPIALQRMTFNLLGAGCLAVFMHYVMSVLQEKSYGNKWRKFASPRGRL